MRSIRAYLIGFLATAGLTVACSGGDGEGTDSSGECAGGEMQCDGMCVNTNIDEDNCGGCGITCNDGFVCAGGSCMADCAGGTSKCGEECVDLLDNVSNCGACGEACGTGEMCNLGVCTSCTAGETVCGNECVDTSVSNSHCGACDNACEPGEPCNDGACGLSCGAGETNCDGVCTDTDGDAANCGSCGNTCGVNQQCFDGVCVDPCAQDETLCDGECVDTSASAAHCGGCGSACGQDEVCVDGSCSPPCADDEALCGGVCVDPQSSPEHCGGCDNLCEYPNAAAVCELGVCALGMCDSGWADLDDDPGNGCEVEVPRRAFVTSVTYNGNLGGVAGADAKCQTLALSAGLGGTWRAWLSDDSATPATRFMQTMTEVQRLDGNPVASDWTDLTDGNLLNAISVTEKGTSVGSSIVWTNTLGDGTMPGTEYCANWTSSSGLEQGLSGNSAAVDETWTNASLGPCNSKRRLYCFEL
ncbi:MAG: DUF1554 domain-containing protein [Myxococcales bacterium]|nr:DUF1554 domain-containing protein [Myxococcales bacterium]